MRVCSNGKNQLKRSKQCCAPKSYRSYSSPRKVQNTVTQQCVTHRIRACTLQRIATVAHYSNVTLRRSTKENKSRCIHTCQNIIVKSVHTHTTYKEQWTLLFLRIVNISLHYVIHFKEETRTDFSSVTRRKAVQNLQLNQSC